MYCAHACYLARDVALKMLPFQTNVLVQPAVGRARTTKGGTL